MGLSLRIAGTPLYMGSAYVRLAVRGIGGGGRSGAASAAVGGVIRILDNTNENNADEEMVEIYYALPDYKLTGHSSSSRTLAHQDLIEFTLVIQQRTPKNYVRDITLVQSERE